MPYVNLCECCDVSAFEKLRFQPSTREQENGVFKKIHCRERILLKASFSVTENTVSMWTLYANPKRLKKMMRFSNVSKSKNAGKQGTKSHKSNVTSE